MSYFYEDSTTDADNREYRHRESFQLIHVHREKKFAVKEAANDLRLCRHDKHTYLAH